LETPGLGDELAQLHCIIDTIAACLRRAQEETTQDTQGLAQVQKDLEDERSVAEWEKLDL
jgi:hypothetical protein